MMIEEYKITTTATYTSPLHLGDPNHYFLDNHPDIAKTLC